MGEQTSLLQSLIARLPYRDDAARLELIRCASDRLRRLAAVSLSESFSRLKKVCGDCPELLSELQRLLRGTGAVDQLLRPLAAHYGPRPRAKRAHFSSAPTAADQRPRPRRADRSCPATRWRGCSAGAA